MEAAATFSCKRCSFVVPGIGTIQGFCVGLFAFVSLYVAPDTFGEIAVMDGLPRTAAATALENPKEATFTKVRVAVFPSLST